jgi:hypothetical protein
MCLYYFLVVVDDVLRVVAMCAMFVLCVMICSIVCCVFVFYDVFIVV